jgi:hypothetical protein
MVENWTIADIYGPLDVLNRRDFERNFYDPDKLGELMLRLRYLLPEVSWFQQPALSLYLLPLFRQTPLPGNEDRFAFDLTGDGKGDLDKNAVVASPEVNYAARLGATILGADVFLAYYGGPTRFPALAVSPDGTTLRPVYYRVDFAGLGIQRPMGPWLFKLETASTWTHTGGLEAGFSQAVPDSYFQYVIGIDRTFTDVLGKSEVTVTLEYAGQNDPRHFDLGFLNPYKSDLFLGVRWQFHDTRRTEIRASAAVDVLVDEQLYLASFSTTLYGNLRLVLVGQFVRRAPPDTQTVFNLFPNNSNLQLTLRYEF